MMEAIKTSITAALEVCFGIHPMPYFIEAEALCATKLWKPSALKVFMTPDRTVATFYFHMTYKKHLSKDNEQVW